MTRHSGSFIVHCKDREQADMNVAQYANHRVTGKEIISFFSIKDAKNITLMSDIIGICVSDGQLMMDIHRQDAIAHGKLQKDLEFSQNEEDDE